MCVRVGCCACGGVVVCWCSGVLCSASACVLALCMCSVCVPWVWCSGGHARGHKLAPVGFRCGSGYLRRESAPVAEKAVGGMGMGRGGGGGGFGGVQGARVSCSEWPRNTIPLLGTRATPAGGAGGAWAVWGGVARGGEGSVGQKRGGAVWTGGGGSEPLTPGPFCACMHHRAACQVLCSALACVCSCTVQCRKPPVGARMAHPVLTIL